MKRRRILAIVLTLCLVFGMTPITGNAAGSATSGFSDISGHWAENQIVKWFGLGVIAGDETDSGRMIRSRGLKWRRSLIT